MKVESFPAAEEDMAEAASEYETRAPGLGDDFIREIERVTGMLIELPSLGEKLDEVHRRIPLRRFPYGLIFRCDGNTVRIVAIAHRRRRPRYWMPRVHDR